ncbi:hypothetical protein MRB53_032271 [Persea americana]|uniref:Uncharacterized protein n=1 Tax=Persea americana TaxID=3435 RepID=A0ACC2KRC4_PERAE|nr:hypothetical protein MRB53_032271 [Persea americana]
MHGGFLWSFSVFRVLKSDFGNGFRSAGCLGVWVTGTGMAERKEFRGDGGQWAGKRVFDETPMEVLCVVFESKLGTDYRVGSMLGSVRW